MSKPRKTVTCWRFYCHYGQGWEHEITEYTRAEMRENAKAYRENSTYPLRIKRGREKIADMPLDFRLNILQGATA